MPYLQYRESGMEAGWALGLKRDIFMKEEQNGCSA